MRGKLNILCYIHPDEYYAVTEKNRLNLYIDLENICGILLRKASKFQKIVYDINLLQ